MNVKPTRGGGGGRAWGGNLGDLTIFKNLTSNSLPTGKSFQSSTMKISPNKTLKPFFINVAASPKIHVPVTAAIIRFNHNPCYTA